MKSGELLYECFLDNEFNLGCKFMHELTDKEQKNLENIAGIIILSNYLCKPDNIGADGPLFNCSYAHKI